MAFHAGGSLLQSLEAWRRSLTVPQFTVVTGLLVIASGTLLLASPLCSTDDVGLWQALFTVTSAITVTGLSIIVVERDLTVVGQIVLASYFVVGGLGLMAITTFLQGFVQGRSGLRARLDKGRTLDEFGVGGIGPTFRKILLVAGSVMGVGAFVLYTFGFADIDDPFRRLWASVFHVISAYNNSGFGLWANNLEDYRDNTVVTFVIASMIVLGGIGWRVVDDLWVNRRRIQRVGRLGIHTRIVLQTTFLLILGGAAGLLLTEHFGFGAQGMVDMTFFQKLQVVLFQSISTRTAGFNIVPMTDAAFSDAGLLLMIVLMFIGASPGGTGGGIKTTTFAILLAATRSTLEGRDYVLLRQRRIPSGTLLRAVGVTLASVIFVVVMALLLGIGPAAEGGTPGYQRFTFLEKLFTCVSAFATVGLDVGVTANLNRWGQFVLMVGMFVGRIGILLLLSAVVGNKPPSRVGYQQEDLYV